jgi:hypothetical protein
MTIISAKGMLLFCDEHAANLNDFWYVISITRILIYVHKYAFIGII